MWQVQTHTPKAKKTQQFLFSNPKTPTSQKPKCPQPLKSNIIFPKTDNQNTHRQTRPSHKPKTHSQRSNHFCLSSNIKIAKGKDPIDIPNLNSKNWIVKFKFADPKAQ